MLSCIDSLQQAIIDKLRSTEELNNVRIYKENSLFKESCEFYGDTISLYVKIPIPTKTSPSLKTLSFSNISISLILNAPRNSAKNIYSPIYFAEIISKTLHNWKVSNSCGFGTIFIEENNPWSEYLIGDDNFKITLNFSTQSIA